MPSRKGKGKGDGKNKGGKPFQQQQQQQQPPQANVAQQASSSASQALEKPQKPPKPKKAGVMIMTPIGQMIGQHMNPITDMMEITPKVIGTICLTMLPLKN